MAKEGLWPSLVKRKAQKTVSIGKSADRNEQFENIAGIKAAYEKSDNPVISVDTKKKNI
jgi:adenylylsulfate kinase-like enzyme